MVSKSLNGTWQYRVGKGKFEEKCVPFSALPVGHFECVKNFDLENTDDRIFIKFYGITYYAKVFLNNTEIGEMLPYCEYQFEITKIVKKKDNMLLLEMEDIAPMFGPTAGWENFGGIIRDVELLFSSNTYIEDIFFHSKLLNNYEDAEFIVETKSNNNNGIFNIKLLNNEDIVAEYNQSASEEAIKKSIFDVLLWSPDAPNLYTLYVTLLIDGVTVDTYTCKVGFREFVCDKHHFLLNGKPLFIKGVCKHEMFGDSGHCPSYEQMRFDMQMIKDTGCNFVRLVHYPHNKRILKIADEIGLMVSEEPGLWWSDTSKKEISDGSLEVLRRTILRDRNHSSIVFWLSFNECKFTEEYLVQSAKVCKKYDPTRLVSGANCMSNEDTLKYYNLCGFDFYTMHPYSQTIDRAKESAKILNDKPLLFTEWGGHFVYDNPKLLGEFMSEMYKLFKNPSEEGTLAGASFWEWSELNDYNRGGPACLDGTLKEGLVDRYRKPGLIFPAFCEALKNMGADDTTPFWVEEQKEIEGKNLIRKNGDRNIIKGIIEKINEQESASGKLRKRNLSFGPVLNGVNNILNIPYVLEDNQCLKFDCEISSDKIALMGMVSIIKGYPLSGAYGEEVAELKLEYENGEQDLIVLRNGIDITTVFETNESSKINPIAENSERILTFGYNKNFERYIINSFEIDVCKSSTLKNISITSKNNGYALLIYGILI